MKFIEDLTVTSGELAGEGLETGQSLGIDRHLSSGLKPPAC